MHTTVKFAKVRPTAKTPTKRVEDAGYSRTLCYNGEIYFANYLNEVKKMS